MDVQASEIAKTSNAPLTPPPPIGNGTESQLGGRLKVMNRHISKSSKLVREHLCRLNEDDSELDDNMKMKKYLSEKVLSMSFKHRSEIWRSLLMDDKLFFILQNSNVKPILQIGPSCGIAALCMALNALSGYHNSILPGLDEIVVMARSLNLTNFGEMFSAQALLSLSSIMSPEVPGVIIEATSLFEKKKLILSHLLQKRLVIIPYDKGPNNEPCFKNGLKAHWAVLTGLLIVTSKLSVELENFLENQNDSKIFSIKEYENHRTIEHVLNCLEKDYKMDEDIGEDFEMFVCARQGKSPRLHLWHLNELLKSNDQLLLNPQEDCYLLHDGGVLGGLCGKVIILGN